MELKWYTLTGDLIAQGALAGQLSTNVWTNKKKKKKKNNVKEFSNWTVAQCHLG